MRSIQSLEELNIPYDYKGFLNHFISNIAKVGAVSKVVLFGSCAREQVKEKSDIDLLVITEKDIPIDDEFYIMSECPPAYDEKFYVPADIIVNSLESYNRFKNTFGMVQKAVEREGVDLSELIR